ncbi:MAG TPA: S8 family peptidase [Casimicrobiaceae bacterium]|nr:S8 family peptidase [Casimicrobiaceae bacterium]
MAAFLAAPFADAQIVSSTETARVIVKFKSDFPLAAKSLAISAPLRRAESIEKRIGRRLADGPAIADDAQVIIGPGMTSAELVQALQQQPDVEYAVVDRRRRPHVAPNDPLYGSGVAPPGPTVGQWYLRAPDAIVKSSIDVEPAWAVTTGSANVVVAVLDSGIRFDHPDLVPAGSGGNVLAGYDMISDIGVANDGDGRDADATDPGDFVTAAEAGNGQFDDCDQRNSSWHGTLVAGIIGARTDNGIGMASVARNVRLLPVRVLGKCGGFDSDIIAGMRWAAGLSVPGLPINSDRANVINLSLGGESNCNSAYQQTVTELVGMGIVIVASAGNSAGHRVGTPANCNGVIAVGGLRHVGAKVGFSDVGETVAISAPGGNCINVTPGSECLYPILTTNNAGATTPGESTYTHSFDISVGTSFSTPLVSGTVALMLSAQPSLSPIQVRTILQSTSRTFPTTGGDNGDGTPVLTCQAPQFTPTGQPIDQLQCYCTIDTCGAGMLDAGAAVNAAAAGAASARVQTQGLWWNRPAGSESGWGLKVAHHADTIFATWFTYDSTGRAWWLAMTGRRTGTAPDVFTGTLIETRGPPFDAMPFDPAQVTRSQVGTATLTFADVNRGTFSYVVNGIAQTKAISRTVFGVVPKCTATTSNAVAQSANYQDVWWAASGAESGWGINFAHQGDAIFATWFTYDAQGRPLWLSAHASRNAAGLYQGDLVQTNGTSFASFSAAQVVRNVVGSTTLAFTHGNAGTFTYTYNGVTQTRPIARLLFSPPAATSCS